MDKKLEKFVDESVLQWIEENKDNLKTMYDSYVTESKDSVCSFEEFAIYAFYEYGH